MFGVDNSGCGSCITAIIAMSWTAAGGGLQHAASDSGSGSESTQSGSSSKSQATGDEHGAQCKFNVCVLVHGFGTEFRFSYSSNWLVCKPH